MCIIQTPNQFINENGEKTGRLLARQLKHQDINNIITAIGKYAKVITSSKEINTVFKTFYQDLYTYVRTISPEELNSFFSKS